MRRYQELLHCAAAGDKRAFAELVRRFYGMAKAQALQRLRDPALAEDAVQEAFLAVWLNLPSLRTPDSFPSWLRSIVVNCCNRILRQRLHETRAADIERLELLADETTDPVVHYARYQTRDMVLSFMATLAGPCREVAVQRYLLGRSYDEIAASLGLPVGTIKRRLHDVRNRLLTSMASEDSRSIRVGYLPISDHLLPMVAHQRHDQAAFRVLLRKFLSWSGLVKALVNERLDAAMVMAPLAMVLHNRGQGLKWVLDGHHEGSSLTMHRSMPQRSGSNWQHHLTGATLGLPHALSTHGVILRSLAGGDAAGCPFRARYMGPSYMNQPLTERSLDGFFCAEPWGVLSEASGSGRVVLRSQQIAPDHVCCVLVARSDFAHKHPTLLHDYLRHLLAAADYVRAHPQESAEIQHRYTGVDTDAACFVLQKGYVSFKDLLPSRERVARIMDLTLRAGILDRPCSLESLLLSEHP